jgi:hypothetical protein
MSFAAHLRNLARRCLGLSKTAVKPEVAEQMQVWAADLADEADRAERRKGPARMARRERGGRRLKRRA